MSAQVVLGEQVFTIRGADHLQVEGPLVQIQRSTPTGFETVAVAGEKLLVTVDLVESANVVIREWEEVSPNGALWQPVGAPLD